MEVLTMIGLSSKHDGSYKYKKLFVVSSSLLIIETLKQIWLVWLYGSN